MAEQPGSETPEQKVLRNPLILNLILTHPQWTPSQLKTFRQVSKIWRFVSTAELLKRDCLQVRLTVDHKSCRDNYYYAYPKLSSGSTDSDPSTKSESDEVKRLYYKKLEPPSHSVGPDVRHQRNRFIFSTSPFTPLPPLRMDLPYLNKFLKKSRHWPTTSFKFIGGRLSSPEATEFFSLQGKNIKTLTLCSDPRGVTFGMDRSNFVKILTEHVPNLEHLILNDLCFDFDWDVTSRNLLFLPKLETLTVPPGSSDLPFAAKDFQNNLKTVKMILIGSPNLQSIRNVSPPYFRTILDTGKSGLVTQIVDFDFHFSCFHPAVEDFTDFAQTGPRLDHIKIVWPPQIDLRNLNMTTKTEIMRVINLIVQSSRLTLQEVEVKGDVDEVVTFGGPLVLEGLSSLEKLSFSTYKPHERAPKRMQIGWDFPKLGHFDWRHADVDPILFKNMPNCNVTMRTFTRLEIMEKTLPIFGKELLAHCPQLKILKLHCHDDGHGCSKWLQNVFELDHILEELELIFDRMTSDFRNLDETLTGIPEEVCHQIFCMNDKQRVANFESLRSAPVWLGSLNGYLKRFRITFTSKIDQWTRCSACRRPFPLTFVSGLYAFELVPSIKVTIAYDENVEDVDALIGVLQNIAPFVRIIGV